MLACKECGGAVERKGESLVRACGHGGAVVAALTAKVSGKGGLMRPGSRRP